MILILAILSALITVAIIHKVILGVWFPWQETDLDKALKDKSLRANDYDSPDEMIKAWKEKNHEKN